MTTFENDSQVYSNYRNTQTSACSWCATGAIQAVVPINIDPLQYYDLLTTLAPYGIVLFNDDTNRTKEDILEVYDEAIARCENDH